MENPKTPRSTTRERFGWAMYDFANSSYTTVIITVVFSVLFPRLIVGDGPDFRQGNLLWSVALSVSYLITIVLAPLLGAIMDHTAAKKRFLLGSTVLTVAATAALALVSPGDVVLCMALLIASNVGFSLGEAFIAAFLPHLGEPEELGRISGTAWALGYFGGLLATAIVLFGLGPQTLENFPALRWVGPITAAFFGLASIPTFLWLREHGAPRPLPPGRSLAGVGLSRLRDTVRAMGAYRDLGILFLSFLFAYAGLSIVISFAFIYGDQVIRWTPGEQTLMFLLTQLSAAAGAFAFGHLQERLGAKTTYVSTLVLWVVTILLIAGTPDLAAWLNARGIPVDAAGLFLVAGTVAGLGLGATQSSCRAMVGLFSPESKSGEFFGLWSLTGRVASIAGLLGLGWLQLALGLRSAVLLCAAFFVVAIVIAMFLQVDRGRAAARAHEGE
ncbi:MAG: MFS transporter [Deltaproteobacteria bacterium HGW-Deltaproteobacteria-17]|nr:MAG: MFS transporter [Deltaproteobacteria bacterium HGW-Deltaproteobacteria-17]